MPWVTVMWLQVVLDTVESHAAEADEALRAATDSRRLGGLAAQAAPKAGAARQGQVRVAEVLWSELDACMKKLHDIVVVVWHLQRVVNKKRDPLTLAAFVDTVQVRARGLACVACVKSVQCFYGVRHECTVVAAASPRRLHPALVHLRSISTPLVCPPHIA